MPHFVRKFLRILPLLGIPFKTAVAPAAQGGNAASVRGTVSDPSGAVIPGLPYMSQTP